jgi:hypothetical protein
VRSTTKASSAGSSTHRAKGLGRVVRGAGATRALSQGAGGSGAPSRRGRLVVLSLLMALLSLALFASAAFASKEVISDFGTAAGSSSYGGELNNPRDVAVNESGVGPANAGDTYVADEANNRIERFDSEGSFVSAWGKDTIASSINERQRIVVEATGGTYTLSFNGSTTEPIPFYTGGVDFYLAQLPTVGGFANVVASGRGTPADPIIVTFKGTLAGADQPTLTADTSQLSGTLEISTIVNGTSTVPNDTGTGFEICTVATECKAGTASGENGALGSPQSVAVDQDTGNVYVSDRENRRIDEYDGEGNFIRAFGFDVAESGPGDTGTGYEVCSEADGDACKSGVAGSGVGQYGEGFPETGFGIAVSPADANASTGTVYLADSGNLRVSTYHLDGTSPSSFGSAAQFGEGRQPRSVAVDSRGIVYASGSNNNGDVERYDSQNANGGGVGFLAPIVPPNDERQEITFTGFNAGDSYTLTCPDGIPTEELTYIDGENGRRIINNGLEAACGVGNFFTSGEPPNVTVVFEGAFKGANQPQMACTVLSGTGSCSVATTSEGHPGPLLGGNASSVTAGLAVNPAGTVLYVLRAPPGFRSGAVVQQFGPTNAPGLTAPPTAVDDTHGAGGGLFGVKGFGLDSASGRLYVSATGDPDGEEGPMAAGDRVYVLGDSSALPDPTASMDQITAVADRSATFEGMVDPKGGLVGCKFQYSTDETEWTDASVLGCATLDQNGGAQNVSQRVTGLIPDTHYFVRLQVTRPYFLGFTPVTSNVQSFTTATGPPVISSAAVKTIDEHSVRVVARIDPSHSPTTYVVQYGATPALGSSSAPVSVGAGTQPFEVSPVIGGLNPATQYYFKLIATSLVGSTPSKELTAATFPSPPSFSSCPNNLLRTGPSAKLPDCRAYEQVTPTDKYGADAYGSPYSVQASSAGDGITSFTLTGFPGAEGFQQANVLLSRFAGGEWSIGGLSTPPSYGDNVLVMGWTPDLALSFASALAEGVSTGGSLVMRDSASGSRTVLIPQGVGLRRATFVIGGAFDGDSKVVFQAEGAVPVTSGPAPVSSEPNVYLYDRDTGELTLAGLLPDSACVHPPCIPPEGSKLPTAFQFYAQEGHVVSPSGDVYFTDASTGRLYLRRDAGSSGASTVYVAASHKTNGPVGEPQPAAFQGATLDGSEAFFTSSEELTNDAQSPSNDLYRYDVGSGELTDLAPDTSNPGGAQVVGMVGYSDDGSYVYFAANGDLDEGGQAEAGDCHGFESSGGSCSLYLWQADGTGSCTSVGGCVKFIVRLNLRDGDGYNWAGNESFMKSSRVSSDGRILVFGSSLQLTAYDNKGTPEFYRYDAESEQVSCLTCNPTGAPPVGAPDLKNPEMYHAESSFITYSAQPFLSRNLSTDGNRFFFQSTDRLVPADINGEAGCSEKEQPQLGNGPSCRDVYEWEAAGTGSCTTTSGAYSPANGGCIYLLSTGTGAYPTYLADVSESGDTAFIFSRQQLVPIDEDTQEDIYAVKVDGGLAYQHAARPAACEGDACRGASSKPSDAPGAGSGVFEGPGNPKQSTNSTRCPKNKRQVRSKGKVHCVAKHAKHKRHGKQKHHKRAANNNRRASR